jgi:DNA-directed RNA polymerase subunit RPC12/RpoP
MVRVKCSRCGQTLEYADAQRGTATACKFCGKKFRVPTGKDGAQPADLEEAVAPASRSRAPLAILVILVFALLGGAAVWYLQQ